MYDSIAEYQCAIEVTMGIARVFIFGSLTIVGLIGVRFDASSLQNLVRIVTQVSVLFITLMNMGCLICEKLFLKEGITEA